MTSKKTKADFTRRKKPKQQRAITTAEAVIQAAEQVIISEGFQNATTNRIAEVAGVSIGSLYQYFPNKEAIVAALIEETVSKAAINVRNRLRQMMDEPLESALRKIMSFLLEMYKENNFVLFRILEQVPELKQHTNSIAVEKYTHSTNIAFLEQHAEELKVTDLRTAQLLIERATISNIELFIAQNPTDISEDEFVEEITKMAYNYLTK